MEVEASLDSGSLGSCGKARECGMAAGGEATRDLRGASWPFAEKHGLELEPLDKQYCLHLIQRGHITPTSEFRRHPSPEDAYSRTLNHSNTTEASVSRGRHQDKDVPQHIRLLVFVAGPALERARPLFKRLVEKAGFIVETKTDEDLKQMAEPPACDALLMLWSHFFQGAHEEQLKAISERAKQHGAILLNDVTNLVEMQDRRWLLHKLRKLEVNMPDFVVCSRDKGNEHVLEEQEDYIIVSGQRIVKPFVEKPVDRRDREIYVYFPKEAGGGRALLSTRESGDVEYVCRFDPSGKVRREGSFVYQEYLQSEGFVVQAVCIGSFAYGNAVMSGMVRQGEASSVADVVSPVILRQEEKLIAVEVQKMLGQMLFGITFVRSQTAGRPKASATSYVIDVWPGIPRGGLGAHRDDIVKALHAVIHKAMRKDLCSFSCTRSRSAPRFEVLDEDLPPAAAAAAAAQIGEANLPAELGSPISPTSVSSEAAPESDLLCVLLVARHSERTPKQKVKNKITCATEYAAGWFCSQLYFSNPAFKGNFSVEQAIAPPSSFELRDIDQLARLAALCQKLQEAGQDVGVLSDALKCTQREGTYCHAKVVAKGAQLATTLKWGGELTEAGVREAEDLGRDFRKDMYPGEDIDELHATLRHDVKVYASREPRCKQTAAAFCKGLMRLSLPLPPIVVSLVRTDECGRLGSTEAPLKGANAQSDGAADDNGLPPAETPWSEIEMMVESLHVAPILRKYSSPSGALQALHQLLQEMQAALQDFVGERLYGDETASLLRERYKDALEDALCLDKVSHVLDHLQYDHRHNREKLPQAALQVLKAALPLCEAICDVIVPLEAVLARGRARSGSPAPGMELLKKLRWDLRVASGADLGDETAHLQRHEALYAAVGAKKETGVPCVRTRLYFTHNSQVQGLLGALVGGGKQQEDQKLLTSRLGFLSFFVMTLRRQRADNALRVSCEFAPSGNWATRVRLFDFSLEEVDSWWSDLLQPGQQGEPETAASPV